MHGDVTIPLVSEGQSPGLLEPLASGGSCQNFCRLCKDRLLS